MVSFQHLKYFVTIIDSGSLNKASKILFVSQPALSKQINQLEQELMVTLIRRKSTGIELTEAGEFFYQKAVYILGQVNQLLEGVQAYAEAPPLRIGALPSLASYYLPPFISSWSQQHGVKPSLSIRDTTRELVDMVEMGELDLAIVQDYQCMGKLGSLHLSQEPYDVLLPHSHVYSEKEKVTLQEFTQQPLILHKHPCDIRHSFQSICTKEGIQPLHVIDIEFNESIIPFVANGLGLSMVPRMVADHIYDPRVLVKALEPAPARTIHAVYHPKEDKWIKLLFNNVV